MRNTWPPQSRGIRREFGEEGARWAGECERPRRERVLACLQERR